MSASTAREIAAELDGTTIVSDGKEHSFKDIKYKKLQNNYDLSFNDKETGITLYALLSEDEIEPLLNGDEVNGLRIKEFQEAENITEITPEKVSEIRQYFTEGPTEEEANEKYNILGIKPWMLDEISNGDIAGKDNKYIAETINHKIKSGYVPEEIKVEDEIKIEETPIISSEEKLNQPDYKYYVLNDKNKILTGWEYKEDARDFKKEQQEYGKLLVISSKRDLKQQGIDPDDNNNWGEDTPNKQDIAKRAIMWFEEEVKELSDENIVAAIAGNSTHNKDVERIKKLISNSKFGIDEDNNYDEFLSIITLYGDEILHKAKCARKYRMYKTEVALRKEYNSLSVFY